MNKINSCLILKCHWFICIYENTIRKWMDVMNNEFISEFFKGPLKLKSSSLDVSISVFRISKS